MNCWLTKFVDGTKIGGEVNKKVQLYSLERLEPLGKLNPSSNKTHFTEAHLFEERMLGMFVG